ncbi:hypothetical protein RJ55_05621 [Drechmeria coniospora]|nr:hypothetical protein RJ55_05621 [Drechmeria coniospora]
MQLHVRLCGLFLASLSCVHAAAPTATDRCPQGEPTWPDLIRNVSTFDDGRRELSVRGLNCSRTKDGDYWCAPKRSADGEGDWHRFDKLSIRVDLGFRDDDKQEYNLDAYFGDESILKTGDEAHLTNLVRNLKGGEVAVVDVALPAVFGTKTPPLRALQNFKIVQNPTKKSGFVILGVRLMARHACSRLPLIHAQYHDINRRVHTKAVSDSFAWMFYNVVWTAPLDFRF